MEESSENKRKWKILGSASKGMNFQRDEFIISPHQHSTVNEEKEDFDENEPFSGMDAATKPSRSNY